MAKILAFLQNQWFREPEKVKAIMERNPGKRNWFIGTYLFMGCLTGRRLEAALGEDLCNEIIWEEVSPEIGGKSSSAFPADLPHIRRAIEQHKPDVILAFGKIAKDALQCMGIKAIFGPHPAARFGAVQGLEQVAADLKARLATGAAPPESS